MSPPIYGGETCWFRMSCPSVRLSVRLSVCLSTFSCPVYNSHKNYWISKCFGQFVQLYKRVCRAQHPAKSLKPNPSCDHFFVFRVRSITLTKMIEFQNALVNMISLTRRCAEHKIHFNQIRQTKVVTISLFFCPHFSCPIYNSHKND